MADEEYINARDLVALAIFPLPNAVLLPGSLLPLHVFEPRYRDLTRDVLDGSRLMGVPLLRPGFESNYDGRPPVYPTTGIGRIIACEELPDGRYHVLLRGLARARIEQELPIERSYRQVRADLLGDAPVDDREQLGSYHQQLVALCDRLSLAMDHGGAQLRELVRSERQPGLCADMVAAALVQDIGERQRLLETADPIARVARTAEHVGRLLIELGPSHTELPN